MDELQSLTDRMRSLGAPRPDGWASSEMNEGIAQQARYLFLRSLWPRIIDAFSDTDVLRQYPAFQRVLDSGADPDDVVRAARLVAYQTAFELLYHVDSGADDEAPVDAPGWRLMETTQDRELTGRDVGGLHESLQRLDPSGNESLDLFK